MKGAKHFNKPDGNARPQGKLATKEEVQTMTTPEQIALIETIAEKVTSNPAENVAAAHRRPDSSRPCCT